MIAAAERSVWLSSLTFPSASLVELLERKAKAGLSVTVVLADRTVKTTQNAEIGRLTRARARCCLLASTHSKALVIDEELVLLGSANAHRGHRDLCVSLRDVKLASEIIAYLDGLVGREPRRGVPRAPDRRR